MPNHATSHDPVEQAAALARRVAPELGSILLTHYPDAETLDTLRPGEADLATVTRANQAVAQAMAEDGVEILVQRADRAAFRRWLHGREDTPAMRRQWVHRGHLLRGDAALALLGAAPSAPVRPPVFAKAPGPGADRLLRAYEDEDSDEFGPLVEAMLAAGRSDLLELAVRKTWEYQGDEAADELSGALLELAEGAAMGPSSWAELVAVPVALPAGALPDAPALAAGLIAAGIPLATEELRFLPGWRAPEAIAELTPGAVRRVLLDLLAGREPADLPPGDSDDLARRGFGVLLGLRVDWDVPVWEEIAANDGLPDEADDEELVEAREAAQASRFDDWRQTVFAEGEGCVPLGLVALSAVAEEIAEFLREAGAQVGGLEEIRAFLATARDESGGEDIVCRAETVGGALELTVYTVRGRYLDSITVPAETLPVPVDEMPAVLGAFVTLVASRPAG